MGATAPGARRKAIRVLGSWTDVPPDARGASAAIGNFDGVHLGHRAVIDAARRPPAELGVVTFEPHPRGFFAPGGAPFRLMNSEARASRLGKLGVDTVFELPFDGRLAGLGPEDFVEDVLRRGLGLSHVVAGADFRFGKGRAGNASVLTDLCAARGIDVTIAPLLAVDETEVSSTAIREALTLGRPRDAARMLGHRHRIEGEVLHGEKRGRGLGYPTANMSIAGLHPPRFGVYAVTVDILDGPHAGSYGGAASIGVRPMFGENAPNLETFLFDFSGDIYGRRLSVGLVEWLRGEEKFDGVDALVARMADDCARAREILAASE